LDNILIVGATGYIGKSLFSIARQHDSKTTKGTSSNQTSSLLRLRLEDFSEFDFHIHAQNCTSIITAAISSPDVCANDYERAWKVNVTNTSLFVEKFIQYGGRVIFFSSDTIYGEREDEFDEYAVCNPAGEYAVMKREVEQRFLGNSSFKSVRLSYVFSHEDKFTRYLHGCAQHNEVADLFHPFYRPIVHRDDVVVGALELVDRWHEFPEQFINFGGPQVLSRVEMTECIRDVYHYDLHFKVTEPDVDFFKNRPRFIAMKSPLFGKLLKRPPRSLCEAAQIEFDKHINVEKFS